MTTAAGGVLAYLPSPSRGVWHLGPLPIRAYALCIILGVIVAVWLGGRRWVSRGGDSNVMLDIATWAVPFGLVGGRLYHVITDWELYFKPGEHPVQALEIWRGGLGIWGAIALGALGAWIGARRAGVSMSAFVDSVAPGVAVAQAIGRWGNYFNQELFGKPTTVPWGLKIAPGHAGYVPGAAAYQPTFLYESLWCLGVAWFVWWAGRRFSLHHGRTFALYVASYTVGRGWIEYLRVDPAHHLLGLRLNDWTSIIVFLAAVGYMWVRRDSATVEVVSVAREPAQEGHDGTSEQTTPLSDTLQPVSGAAKDDETASDAEGSGASPPSSTHDP